MTLPDVCPRDGISSCKRKACHLYMVEWRTGDEQCIIGYRSTQKELSRSVPLEDTYAQRTRIRLERKSGEGKTPLHDQDSASGQRKHLEREISKSPDKKAKVIDCGSGKEHVQDAVKEEVVHSNKDTTVIESRASGVREVQGEKKRKSLEEMMDLDLPENYEEEFWK